MYLADSYYGSPFDGSSFGGAGEGALYGGGWWSNAWKKVKKVAKDSYNTVKNPLVDVATSLIPNSAAEKYVNKYLKGII